MEADVAVAVLLIAGSPRMGITGQASAVVDEQLDHARSTFLSASGARGG